MQQQDGPAEDGRENSEIYSNIGDFWGNSST